jgi:branched-chain amino acid transport system permease protein
VLPGALLIGLVLEALVFRPLYRRDHLTQVLATFGVILFANEGVKILFGPAPLSVPVPEMLSGSIRIMEGLVFPVYRLAVITAGLGVALLLAWLVNGTRAGMLVRASATNAPMAAALGVDVKRLFMAVAGVGAMLAGFAGAMAAPILSVEAGMGDGVLILAFVVIVIGGIGSIKGAFAGALLVGLVDTLGRSFATDLFKLVLAAPTANKVGPAFAAMAIYLLMAGILVLRPGGLFPAPGRAA